MHKVMLRLLVVYAAWPMSPSAGEELPLHSWAVIASQPLLDSGFADLLTVRLSQDESIQLVERERLRDATRELQLAPLIQAENIDRRLQLGQTLKADTLMVLSSERDAERRLLRVVICDANLGVRLWEERLLDDGVDVDTLVEQCAGLVPEVRTRFASGVQRIIAVPPFLSEDFSHRFDYLQERQSNVVSSALMTCPGVAVVELEEARAVLRELENTLSTGLERPIATIVKGAYRVGAPDEQGQRNVTVQIELVSSNGQEETIHKSFPIGTVGHWLRENLVRRLTDNVRGDRPAIDVARQKAILSRRADQFAALGDWEHSRSLREAALVLDPNDALQRGYLISEFQFDMTRMLDEHWFAVRATKKQPLEPRVAAFQQVAEDYVESLGHLEYLIRNRLIGHVDAVGILDKQRWCKNDSPGEALSRDPAKYAALQHACRAQRRFIHELGAELRALPGGRKLPQQLSTPYYGLEYVLSNCVTNDVVFNNYNSDSLATLQHVLEHVVPEDAKVSARILNQMRRSFSLEQRLDLGEYREQGRLFQEERAGAKDDQARRDALIKMQAITVQSVRPRYLKAHAEWTEFLRKLTRSEREVVRFYGEWGLLALVEAASRSTSRTGAEPVEEFATKVESSLAELKRLKRIGPRNLDDVESRLKMTRNWIKAINAPARSRSVVSQPARPAPVRPKTIGNSLGRLKFEPIDLLVEGESVPRPRLRITGMLSCGPDRDAYWTNDRFFIMEEPGILREVKVTDSTGPGPRFWGMTWDGECIWLYAHGQGIIAVRPDGTRLAAFNQTEHLPGYWKGFQLHGLSPRRAFVVGSFGKQNRAWCGILEVDDRGVQSANLFFEAKYVAEGRVPEEAELDPKIGFIPEQVHHIRHDDGKEYVLVRRRDRSKQLRVDLASLEVSVAARYVGVGGASTCTELGFRGRTFLRDGRLVTANSGLALLPNSRQLVLHDGWIYRAGYVWMRENVETGVRERLNQTEVPRQYRYLYPNVSAHYGLVAYDSSNQLWPFSRVTILPADEADGEPGGE